MVAFSQTNQLGISVNKITLLLAKNVSSELLPEIRKD